MCINCRTLFLKQFYLVGYNTVYFVTNMASRDNQFELLTKNKYFKLVFLMMDANNGNFL
jgi:hypothetical protein